MKPLDRDYQVLVMVSRFGQLGTGEIKALLFNETTRIPCDKVLKRLRDAELLELVEQPHPGGRRGGTSMNVYQLGKNGWSMFYQGRRKVQRAIRYHALTVADVFVAVKQAERAGWLDILDWQVESDAWADVDGVDLRPDMYLELGLPEQKYEEIDDDGTVRIVAPTCPLLLEIDLGGERQKQIIEKLERYAYAYNHAEAYPGDVFPQVVFLCTNADRTREISQIVARMKDLPDGLVTAELLSDFPASLR